MVKKEIKESSYYNELYVLNSVIVKWNNFQYEIEILSDDIIIKRINNDFNQIRFELTGSPITFYKEAEVGLELLNHYDKDIIYTRKISDDIDTWYIQLQIMSNAEGKPIFKRSYHEMKKGVDEELESYYFEIEEIQKLYEVLINELEQANFDLF